MGFLDKLRETIGPKLANVAIGFTVMIAWVFSTLWLVELIAPTSMWEAQSGIWLFFVACVVAPVWEEFVFRVFPIKLAMMLDKALGIKSLWYVVGAASVWFGLGHDNFWPMQLIWQGCMGLVFSYVYIKNNCSYWPNVLLHAMWNFFVIFILPNA